MRSTKKQKVVNNIGKRHP